MTIQEIEQQAEKNVSRAQELLEYAEQLKQSQKITTDQYFEIKRDIAAGYISVVETTLTRLLTAYILRVSDSLKEPEHDPLTELVYE